jgi:hypothetical protein
LDCARQWTKKWRDTKDSPLNNISSKGEVKDNVIIDKPLPELLMPSKEKSTRKWFAFRKVKQIRAGAIMRTRKYHDTESIVKERDGNMIRFVDGYEISISDAKSRYEISY